MLVDPSNAFDRRVFETYYDRQTRLVEIEDRNRRRRHISIERSYAAGYFSMVLMCVVPPVSAFLLVIWFRHSYPVEDDSTDIDWDTLFVFIGVVFWLSLVGACMICTHIISAEPCWCLRFQLIVPWMDGQDRLWIDIHEEEDRIPDVASQNDHQTPSQCSTPRTSDIVPIEQSPIDYSESEIRVYCASESHSDGDIGAGLSDGSFTTVET